jgi:hypothetical protein
MVLAAAASVAGRMGPHAAPLGAPMEGLAQGSPHSLSDGAGSSQAELAARATDPGLAGHGQEVGWDGGMAVLAFGTAQLVARARGVTIRGRE